MAKRRFNEDTEDLPKQKITRNSLKELLHLFRYLKPYRVKFIISLVFLFFSSLTTLIFTFVISKLVDASTTWNKPASQIAAQIPESVKNPIQNFEQWIFSDINHIAGALLVILFVQSVFSFFRIVWFVEVGEKSLADLRKDLYARLIILPMSFFGNRRVGELASRLSADISQIQDTFTTTLAEAIRSTINLVAGIAIIIFMSFKLTLIMLAMLPALMVAAVFFGKFIRKISKQATDKLAESGVVVEETLQGIQNVKSFTNEKYEENRYRSSIDSFVTIVLKAAKYRGAFASFIIFALFGAIVGVLWYGASLVEAGEMTIGELTSFLIYTVIIGAAFGGFSDYYSQLQKTIGATERVRELLQEPTEPLDFQAQNQNKRLAGTVQFQNVGFHYASRPEIKVLKDLNFSALAGQQVALVGPSGAGKSTIASLLLRFYEPTTGQILFDNRPANDYELHYLRSNMAIVPQDVLLFGGSIRENIAYGKLTATDDEIREAARKANALEFIDQFPDKLNTVVGERGVKLSGGQRQRIAIARAVLRDPAILILDEATSSLDSESERLVQEALDNLMKNRTTFVVAHRLSTIRNADKILVIQDGTVVEMGKHDELMQRENGLYRSLASLQFQPETAS